MEQPNPILRNSDAPQPVDGESAVQADSRANIYEFLSRIYLEEVSRGMLKGMREPASRIALDELGIPVAREDGGHDDERLLEELATAFCSTFLVSEQVALYPYESCQRDGCLQGDSTHLVQCFFQKCGVALPEESVEFPDHLGIEFAFMGRLAREESIRWGSGQTAAAARRRKQQKDFLKEHLLVWAPRYGKSLQRLAAHPFYREIGRLTFDFMEMESKEFS